MNKLIILLGFVTLVGAACTPAKQVLVPATTTPSSVQEEKHEDAQAEATVDTDDHLDAALDELNAVE